MSMGLFIMKIQLSPGFIIFVIISIHWNIRFFLICCEADRG